MREPISKKLILIGSIPVMICFVSLGPRALDCSKYPGFIPVSDSDGLGTGDFCVMQHEAKPWSDDNKNKIVEDSEIHPNGCDGVGLSCKGGTHNWGLEDNIPVSIPQGKPWRDISRDSAIRACQKLNGFFGIPEDSDRKFDLISHTEWLIITRDIEQQAANWSGGQVNSGCVYQGNTGKNTLCSYDGGGLVSEIENRKARHVLSNGKSIYHFAGNIWEWMIEDNDGSDYEGAVPREGYWPYYFGASLFTAYSESDPSRSYSGVGFRCVFHTVGSES